MKVTLKDIAQDTGLSLSTVNHVLKDRGCFRAETKRVVQESARKLGYRPNFFAQGIRSGRFNSVALLLSEKSDASYLPKALLESIHDALAKAHMALMVTRLPDRALADKGVMPSVLQHCMVDGLLIDYIASFPRGMIELIRRHKVPVVWINSKQKTNAIYPDDLAAGRQAAQHLLNLGHRRIAYAPTVSGHYSLEERRKGISTTIHQAGGTLQVWSGPSPSIRNLSAFYGRQLRGPDRPTAVISYGLFQATAVCVAAATLNLRIPRDLSIMTFNDVPDESLGITSLLIPVDEMGCGAVTMILRRLEQPNVDLPPVALPFGFARGRTCGPPPPSA